MFTKPLVRQSTIILDVSQDKASINRLLAAAAISPRFCANLLSNPQKALHAGFGSEQFPLSRMTYDAMISIKASSLPEFVHKLEEKVSASIQLI